MPKLPKDWPGLLFVHLAWLVLAFTPGWFVHTQATRYPLMDEWDILREWIQADSLWDAIGMHHNVHRYPLTKLVWLGTAWAAGWNFGAPQYLTLGFLAATALMPLWTARGLRGRSHPVDVLLPALLLHLGNAFNLQMGYQVGFVLFCYGVSGWLWCAGRLAQGGGSGWVVGSCFFMLLMTPCGSFGVLFSPVVVFWLLFLARQTRFQHIRFGLFTYAALTAAYVAWNLLTMPHSETTGISPTANPGEFLTAVAGYLTAGIGCWPAREHAPAWWIVAATIPVLMLYPTAMRTLANRLDDADPRRIAVVALLGVMIGSIIVGAAAAKARGGGYHDRFSTPSAMGLIAALLGLTAFSQLRFSRVGHVSLSVLAILLTIGLQWANFQPGANTGFVYRDSSHELNKDVQAGMPPMYLAGRHGGAPGVYIGERFHDTLLALKRRGIPPYTRLADDPQLTPIPIPGISKAIVHLDDADLQAGRLPEPIRLPDPPPGAQALRVLTKTKKPEHRQKMVLKYTSAGVGYEPYSVPDPSGLPMHMIFPFQARATNLRLLPASVFDEIELSEFEWLMAVSR